MLKKSVIIAGRHYTSITIEKEFYKELEKIAKTKGISINQLVTNIDKERDAEYNLSSAVRVYILGYIMQNKYNPIKDNISNLGNYTIASKQIIDFVKSVTPETPADRYNLEDGVFALVQKYNTKPASEAFLESHRKYIDIQCILDGQEIIEVCPIDGLSIKDDYIPKNDIMFYHDNKNADIWEMTKGTFAIFHPADAHKPCLNMNGKQSSILKIVFKVPV